MQIFLLASKFGTLFYLPWKSDAGALSLNFVDLMFRGVRELESTNFDPWELACAILDVDCWMVCGPMAKAA